MCDHYKDLMNAYLDGDITEAQIRELDLHVESCDTCMVEFEELKYLKHLLDEEGLMPLPDDFDERLHQKLLNASETLNRNEETTVLKSARNKIVHLNRRTKILSSIAAVFVIGVFTINALNGGGLNAFKMGKSYNESTADMVSSQNTSSYGGGVAPEEFTTTTGTSMASVDMAEGSYTVTESEEFASDNGGFTTASGRSSFISEVANQDPVNGYRTNRIIIRNANISIDTEDYDAAIKAIQDLLMGTEGYIASENTSFKTRYSDRDNLKYGSLTLRVTASQFDQMIETIKNQGFVNYNNVSSEDVTKYYRDTASEVENLKVTEARLREILDQAEEVEDILAIETELTRVRGQIDAYTNQLKNWEDLADLSYVYLELNEVTSINPTIEPIDNSIFSRAKEGFIDTINTMIEVFTDTFVWLVSKAPILVILGLLGWFGTRAYRKRTNKDKL